MIDHRVVEDVDQQDVSGDCVREDLDTFFFKDLDK